MNTLNKSESGKKYSMFDRLFYVSNFFYYCIDIIVDNKIYYCLSSFVCFAVSREGGGVIYVKP